MDETKQIVITVPIDESVLRAAVTNGVNAAVSPTGYGQMSIVGRSAMERVAKAMESPEIAARISGLVLQQIDAQVAQIVNAEVGRALRGFVRAKCGDLIAQALGSGLIDKLVRDAAFAPTPGATP